MTDATAPTFPLDGNGNRACSTCGVAVYMHAWTSNRPAECAAGPTPARREPAATKITRLTGLNVHALETAIAEGALSPDVTVTKTTATFPWDANETTLHLRYAIDDLARTHGSRQHPVASLHAVARKINRIRTASS